MSLIHIARGRIQAGFEIEQKFPFVFLRDLVVKMKLTFNDITLDISSNGKIFTLTVDDKTIQAEVLHADREAPRMGE